MGLLSRFFALLSRPFRRGAALVALTGSAATVAALPASSAAGPASPTPPAIPAASRTPQAQVEAQRELAAAFAAFAEPNGRNLLDWTPATIRAAEQQADSGDLSYAAQLCEWLMGDERVATCASTRVQALLGCPISFERGSGRKARAAVRGLEAEEDWWTMLPEAEQARALEWGLLLGVALIYRDHSVRPAPGGREVPRCSVWSARWLRKRDGRWYVRTARPGGPSGAVEEVEATPANGFLLFMPYGGSRPWSRGLWRGLSRLVLVKSYAITDWARHSEVHGNPAWLAVPKDGPAWGTHRAGLSSDLSQLGRDSVIVVPPGYDVRLCEATAKTWEMFVAQVKLANDSIAIGWLGGNLLTDAGDGATTGATAQSIVRHDKRRFDDKTWTTFAHDALLVDWAIWNFGSADAAPWPSYDVDPPADVEAEARALGGLGDAIAKLDAALEPHGLRVDAEEVVQTYSVPTQPWPERVAPALPVGLAPASPASAQPMGAQVIPIARARARRVPWASARGAA